jgi:uncharacterized membrane protein YvbJ
MQIINKTTSCPICGCICLPDAYHCPKCGKSFVVNKEKGMDTTMPSTRAAISITDDKHIPQFSRYYTIYVDMIEQEKAIIILKN